MSKDKINRYTCPDGHQTITIDIDDGTTPMFLNCRTNACGKQATSSFYQVPDGLLPEYEWYKPTDIKKVEKISRDHVRRGGLLIRKIRK